MFMTVESAHPLFSTQLDPPESKSHDQTPAIIPLAKTGKESLTVHDLPPTNSAQHYRHSGWSITRNRIYRSLQRTCRGSTRCQSYADCGSHSYVLRSLTEPHEYRIAGSTCHDRFCTPCAATRSRTIAANVLDRLQGQRARFLTLTVAGGYDGLREPLDHLYKSFSSLRRSSFWRRYVTGGVAFTEIKYSESTHRWHPHLHCIIRGKYIPSRELSSLWRKITGDSFIIDIRAIRDARMIARYVTKYASKPLSVSYLHDDDLLDEAVTVLTGRRLATTFGTWRSVLLSDSISDDGWEQIATLDDLLCRAALGDKESLKIARCLDASATQRTLSEFEFPRPPPKTAPIGTIPDLQLKLLISGSWYP